MDFRTYVNALRRYWWIVVLTTVLGLIGSGAVLATTPKTYASKVTFYVSTPVQSGITPQSANQFAESRVNSYVVLMSSQRVAEAVIRRSGVDLSPTEVMSRMSAEANLNTVVVEATVQDSSAARASVLAQALADTFGDTVSELDNPGTGRATVVINVVSGPFSLGAVAPRVKVLGGLGLLGGLAIGFLLIVLRELLDNTLRGSEAASTLVGAPAIGDISFDRDFRRMPLLLGVQRGSLRAEAFRQLRTNLTFIDVSQSTKVLLVTSSSPGEGKTSICANLALTLAESGHRVLIIEADLRKPRMAQLMGLESEIGLTNLLLGQVAVEEALQPWVENVTVLTSGSLPPNPAELLEGQRMKALLGVLRDRYDRILIDTTPLLPVTDAAVAASLADGVVLVVRQARTTRDQVAAAVNSLSAVNASIVGVVLSMRRPRREEKRAYSFNGKTSTPLAWDRSDDDSRWEQVVGLTDRPGASGPQSGSDGTTGDADSAGQSLSPGAEAAGETPKQYRTRSRSSLANGRAATLRNAGADHADDNE